MIEFLRTSVSLQRKLDPVRDLRPDLASAFAHATGEDESLRVDESRVQHRERLGRNGGRKSHRTGSICVRLIKIGEHLMSQAALHMDVERSAEMILRL